MSQDQGQIYAQAAQTASDEELLKYMQADTVEADQQQAKVEPRLVRGLPASVERTPPGETTPRVGAKPTGAGGIVNTAASVVGDIATGIGESPGAVVGGAIGAAHELADSIDSAGAWVAETAANAVGDTATAKNIADARAKGETALASWIPEAAPSKSVTGNVIQGISQFVTGFVAGGRVLKAAGMIGREASLGSVFLKSAFSDAFAFDPAQQRLSNLVESAPELKNPVTEFLASKPGDSESLGRFKNALEGLGVGGAMQLAFTQAMKGMRALRELRPPPPTPEQIARQVREGVAPLGNAEGAPVTVRTLARDSAPPSGLVGAGPAKSGDEVFINFARIESADDVKSVIQKAANIYKGDIVEAQRGVQSFEATKQLADDMGMTVDELISRPRGSNGARTPFTAEEALAARRIYTASGQKLLELAQKAAGPNAGQIDLFNFRKMMAVHYAIQSEVIGARTETARALSSWKIGAGAGETQLRAIQAAMEGQGADTARMANELARLQAAGATQGAIAQYVRKSAFGTFTQGVREVVVNGFLSNPLTHIVNTVSNTGTFFLSVAERRVAAGISRVTGSDAVASGEAGAMLFGAIEGQNDAWRLAAKTLRTGETTDLLGKVDQPRVSAIASMRNDAFGKSVNAIGTVVRVPTLLMSTADQYFKAINYRAELYSTATRQAAAEGLSGRAFGQRVAEIVANPPEGLRIDAADAALYNTFNNKMGWFGQSLMRLRESGGALNPSWIIATFIRTPVNIARFAFERTPLAPLVGQWRAAIAEGGASRDIALARVALGTMITGTAQQLVSSGIVTGAPPSDPNEAALWQREGRQKYSLKVGDTWFSYNRMDPFGMTMGFAADIQQALKRGEVAPSDVDEWQEVLAAGVAAISDTAMDKTFMSGYANFVEMLNDPRRYATKEINSIVTGFVPFSAGVGAASRLYDPTQRDAKTPLDSIMARIPGMAERIIPRRDLWGAPITDENNVYNAFSPARAVREAPEPIDAELDRLRVYPDGIGWKTSINGVQFDFSENPRALDAYRELAGNGWKHPAWGMGLKDFLNATVSGNGALSGVYRIYTDGEQGGKAAFIRKWIADYREGAARALLNDPKFVDFKSQWEETRAADQQARQRVSLH